MADEKNKMGNKTPFNMNLIALSSIKDKKSGSKEKESSLDDLLKCVGSLASSTSCLKDYKDGMLDVEDAGTIDKYLNGLIKIQSGLLDIARKKVEGTGAIFDDSLISADQNIEK